MYYKNDFLGKLQRRFGKFAINNLMMYIVGAMAVVFVGSFAAPFNLIGMFAFDTAAILQGEVWRIITFIAIPPAANVIFIVFVLYLYWLIGSTLENQWGAFRFNVFYLCGFLGAIAAGLITGYATNFYLNLSLFLAFAILFPNFELRLFFILPIKIKWLALLNLVFLAFELAFGTWHTRAAVLVSLLNIVLFFGKDFVIIIRNKQRRAKWRKSQK